MYAITPTLIQCGFDVQRVEVECHLSTGLPSFQISGLPSTAVKEARDRVRSAIKICGFEFPRRRITINLAPAHIPKVGTHLDLAMAMSLLKASGQIKANFAQDHLVLGELNLHGNFNYSSNLFAIIVAAVQEKRDTKFLIPAILSNELEQIPVKATLLETLACLKKNNHRRHIHSLNPHELMDDTANPDIFSDLSGQYSAQRALQISLAGHHHLLLVGPPGCGKSFIADKLRDLPRLLTSDEHWESKRLFCMCGLDHHFQDYKIPVRSPHHSASLKGIVGGGRPIFPGEVSLAHRGFLILDELPEFRRNVLESLRQIMQGFNVHLSHGYERTILPAVNTVLGTMNPCPCGYFNSPVFGTVCRCLPQQIQLYQSRISGPLLDRFSMSICMQIEDRSSQKITSIGQQYSWSDVARARMLQNQRYANDGAKKSAFSTYFNGQVSEAIFQHSTGLKPGIFRKPKNLGLSNRKHSQLLRIAQTIADMQDTPVRQEHFDEALFLQQFQPHKLH